MPRAYGGRVHTRRDFQASLQGGSIAFGQPPDIYAGQAFTLSAWVRPTAFSGDQYLIAAAQNNCARLYIQVTTGLLAFVAITGPAAVVSTTAVTLGVWQHVAAVFSGNVVTFYIDGELAGSAAYAQTFVRPSTMTQNMAGIGRAVRMQGWGVALTQAQVRADCYAWTAPQPGFRFRCNEGQGTTITDDIGGTVGTLTSVTWSPDVPTIIQRSTKPVGYSLVATHAGDGSFTNAITATATSVATMMAALRGAVGLTMACWVKIDGLLSASVFPIQLWQSNTLTGPRLRLDVAVSFNAMAFQVTGRMGAGSGTFAALTGVTINRTITGRWAHIAATIDYTANRVIYYIDGVPVAQVNSAMIDGNAGAGYTVASGFHPEALSGTEQVQVGIVGAPITAALVSRVVQTDHLVCNRVATAAELRKLFADGTAPAGTVMRLLWNEGLGSTTVDSISGASFTIQRFGSSTTAYTAGWSGDAPK